MDTNVSTLPTTESKMLRAKDTANVVEFWSAKPRAHGGVVSMFNAHFSSMSLVHLGTEHTDTKYWQQPEIEGVRPKHNQNVLVPAVISAMFRSRLLGGASMDHVILLCEATCVDSKLGWYHVPPNSSAPACCVPESTVLCSECVCLCVTRDALFCRCALAQHQCVCEMPRRRAPIRSHDIIMSFKHISNITMSLKTRTNIIITISDIIITQLHLTDIMH